jgi:hypothetical protein
MPSPTSVQSRKRLSITCPVRIFALPLRVGLKQATNLTPATAMKSNDARKEKKKLPTMTAKERKQAKRDKKAAKG